MTEPTRRLAEELCRKFDLLTRGTDEPKENAVEAILEGITWAREEAVKLVCRGCAENLPFADPWPGESAEKYHETGGNNVMLGDKNVIECLARELRYHAKEQP
jgi:hypothetical protein